MILAAGLTPAWQQVLLYRGFRWGEVNRAEEVLRCASGKVCNAGIALHRLGGPSQTLAPLGGQSVEVVALRRRLRAEEVLARIEAATAQARAAAPRD